MTAPPFTISSKSINLIAGIAALLERYAIRMEQEDALRLRKINRMKTIHGSLAIEGNTLSESHVTALLEGKHVVAPVREVQEVRNAIRAYDAFLDFNPYEPKDLLKAHGMMALGLVDNAGHYRRGGVCVAGKNGVSHIAPPADRVPFLISDLFEWLNASDDHILIKSSVFHYEFEFIHPFEDGNGRMGRFWQSRLLADWNPAFANLPIENMIWEHQADYYKAIEKSTEQTDSGIFAEFMLSVIFDSLQSHAVKKVTVNDTVNPENETVSSKNETVNLENETVNDTVNAENDTQNETEKLLTALRENPNASYSELADILGKSRATVSRKIAELKQNGIISRVGSDKNGHWEIIKG